MDRNKKNFLVLLCLAAMTMLLCPGRADARVLPRDQLEAMWIERMLQGRSEALVFGLDSDTPDVYRNPNVVLATAEAPRTWEVEKGIEVQDLRGSYLWRFFGTELSQGGGWQLRGGRLKEVMLPGRSVLELYILRVTRWHAAMLPLWGPYYGKSDVRFKVFLLKRGQSSGKAQILQTWEIPPAQVKWEKVPGPANVMDALAPTASVAYDPGQKRATVTITGITQDITEHLTINRETR